MTEIAACRWCRSPDTAVRFDDPGLASATQVVYRA